ncbi:MAG: apolipoprotein N-acyltransferase [Deltaproteobacteria bacterium]|nr:apolipoprotein N-acyltransferase [Deltaproteobacteria bacterium]
MACNGLRCGSSFLLGLLSGMVTLVGIFWWVFQIPGWRLFHAGMALLYLGLYPALWCAGVALAKRGGCSCLISAPALWVALDYLKSHVGFLSFPWASLAHSQHDYPAILQIASFTGEYGVTFLIVLVNTAVAALLLYRGLGPALVVAVVLVGAVVFGKYQLTVPRAMKPYRVAVVQPCIWPGEQEQNGQADTLARLEGLTAKAAADSPQLVVWPETAVLNLPATPALGQRLNNLSEKQGVPLLVGASERVKFNDRPLRDPHENGLRSYNAAYLIRHGQPAPPPYRKNRLVPFGEYLPLEGIIPWPSWFAEAGFQTVPGLEMTLFDLDGEMRAGVLICWENLFPEMAREAAENGARILVNLINDGWFGKTPASRQHNAASVLRAVENGIPVIVASNCGPSQLIDAHGRIVASLADSFSPGILAAELTIGRQRTLYRRQGDLFAWVCLGIVPWLLIRFPNFRRSRKGWR